MASRKTFRSLLLGPSLGVALCCLWAPGAAASSLATEGMAPLAGQAKTCASDREKTFRLEVREITIDIGGGTQFNAWTYDGQLPGPTLEVCEGDRVTIEVTNKGSTAHGLDTHALSIDAAKFGPAEVGAKLNFSGVATTPGAYMYHCASGPVTDFHIKSGLYGAMIVHPREPLREASHEIVVVESAIFGERSDEGLIPGTDAGRTLVNDAEYRFFNGRLEHEALEVEVGDLIRVYHVNVGPGVSAAHAIGSLLEQVIDGADVRHAVQTYGVPPGSGAILEFRVPEKGQYVYVNHDRLGYVPIGLAVVFQTPWEPDGP